jgi:hypothetical protein
MQDVVALLDEFCQNLDQIATTLVVGFNLKHKREVEGLSEPLLRWLDFRARIIDPRPRQIYHSDQFPKALDERTGRAMRMLEDKINAGEDVNAYQGKGLLGFDFSGKRRGSRTGLLWADWEIHHLHLTDAPVEQGSSFSERTDSLLFTIFYADAALFIDVAPHNQDTVFSRQELFEIVARNWPAVLERHRLKGTLIPGREWTDKERHQLRKSGIEAPLIIGGKAYFAPGGGITSASTPGKVTELLMRLRRNVKDLAKQVLEPTGQFLLAIPESARPEGHFSLGLTPRGLAVIERQTNRGWTFPDAKYDGMDSQFAQISDCLTPPWVKVAMIEAEARGAF